MDKNQITDDGNQSTDFLTLTDTYLILHGDKTAEVLLLEKMHRIKLSAVCGTHGMPDFNLVIPFPFSLFCSQKSVPLGALNPRYIPGIQSFASTLCKNTASIVPFLPTVFCSSSLPSGKRL